MYVVMDCAGNLRGPFTTAQRAAMWAKFTWPEQPANDERDIKHREGWSIVAIRPAD
jgi:hypothetical protein